MASSVSGAQGPKAVILMGGHWYLASPLSTRHVEAHMAERGGHVEHAPINRGVIK